MPFTKLASQSEMPGEGEAREFLCADKTLCVAKINGTITAIDNVCLHEGGPLSEGVIENGKIVFPWHGWEYDLVTGQTGDNPTDKVAVYPIKIEDGAVFVDLSSK
ncbi:MAG TPA: Rieske (2Fe-2S) protein [Terriglobales bacterium]|nr:Rieske (2Fe-2S) protein [Terriglobales bacterium]